MKRKIGATCYLLDPGHVWIWAYGHHLHAWGWLPSSVKPGCSCWGNTTRQSSWVNAHELFTEQTTSVCPLPPPSSPFWHFLPRSPHLVLSTAPTRYWMNIISQLFSDPPWGNQAAFHWTEAQPKDYHVFREQKMQTSSQISIFWEKTQGVKELRKSHRKRTQVRLSADWEILS